MKVFTRPIKFADVDAAGIVFYARFFAYCHDAMEDFFAELPGGYPGVIASGTGLPSVDVHASFSGSLAYGDVARIETRVGRIGTSSVQFRFVVNRVRDDVAVAKIEQVHVVSILHPIAKIAIPPSYRELFARHLDVTS